MNFRLKYYFMMLLILTASILKADQPEKKNSEELRKSASYTPSLTRFNINNISTIFASDGRSDNYINPANPAFEFPKGSGKHLFYQSGLIWGGLVPLGDSSQVRVTGSTYRTAMMPGHVENGMPVDSSVDIGARIFRVRPDYVTADLSSEVNDGEGTESQVRAQYEKDWNEWPAALGAPYDDVDENGVYDPAVDIPGVKGADQTIWFVSNDFNIDQTTMLYGSMPLGIELQTTIWGYKREGALGNTLFRKYVLINKGSNNIQDMYISMWSDPDCGDGNDDFGGIDREKSLMYIYNGKANDATYGYAPPAGGFDFLQGPIVDSPGETGVFMGKKVANKKNLPVTGFYYFINQNEIYRDPEQGSYQTGALEFWNLFQGKIGTSGEYYPVPGGGVTAFPLDGNPLENTGYVDGKLFPPGDRRIGMSSGPFNFDSGDTQEVVVAQIAAGAYGNVDRLGAVGLLRYYDDEVQSTYNKFFNTVVPFTLTPQVSSAEMDEEIALNWSMDPNLTKIEKFDSAGYKFQGYNVYQLPGATSGRKEGKIIATYDLADGIGKILGYDFNEEIGSVLPTIVQHGKDSGLQRYISIKKDVFESNLPLQNGKQYYFAVSAYVYNPDSNVVKPVLFSPLKIYTVMPHINIPSEDGDIVNSGELPDSRILHDGFADASVKVMVVDPSQLKEADYEVAFEEQGYFVDQDGKWKPTNISGNSKLRKDISPSFIDGIAIYAASPGLYTLKLKVHLNSTTSSYCDGIQFIFPKGMKEMGGWFLDDNKDKIYGFPISDTNYVFGANYSSGNGNITGNEIINLECTAVQVPFTISYLMWDDGSNNPAMNASGTITFDTIYFDYKTLPVWNLTNIKTGEKLLTDQTVINRQELLYGDWLTSASDPVVNGLQVMVSGSYDAPIDFTSAELYRGDAAPESIVGSSPDPAKIVLSNYSVFSNIDTSAAWHTYGSGIKDVNVLGKDLELRYTGIWEESKPGLFTIKEGTGSVATLYSALSEADLQNHPLNPNPGSTSPFLIRIPFEVWNKTDNRQVNVLVKDRMQAASANPFYAWNPENRMYFWICETPYHPNSVIDLTGTEKDSLTWTLVSWSANWQAGDKVEIKYTNPIQPGKDVFRFSTKASVIEIEDDEAIAPKEYNLSQNYPNPFNPNTNINFALPKSGNVKITVYDMLGREIEILTNREYSIGTHKITWNASRYSSGVYLYRIEASGFTMAKKMLLIK